MPAADKRSKSSGSTSGAPAGAAALGGAAASGRAAPTAAAKASSADAMYDLFPTLPSCMPDVHSVLDKDALVLAYERDVLYAGERALAHRVRGDVASDATSDADSDVAVHRRVCELDEAVSRVAMSAAVSASSRSLAEVTVPLAIDDVDVVTSAFARCMPHDAVFVYEAGERAAAERFCADIVHDLVQRSAMLYAERELDRLQYGYTAVSLWHELRESVARAYVAVDMSPADGCTCGAATHEQPMSCAVTANAHKYDCALQLHQRYDAQLLDDVAVASSSLLQSAAARLSAAAALTSPRQQQQMCVASPLLSCSARAPSSPLLRPRTAAYTSSSSGATAATAASLSSGLSGTLRGDVSRARRAQSCAGDVTRVALAASGGSSSSHSITPLLLSSSAPHGDDGGGDEHMRRLRAWRHDGQRGPGEAPPRVQMDAYCRYVIDIAAATATAAAAQTSPRQQQSQQQASSGRGALAARRRTDRDKASATAAPYATLATSAATTAATTATTTAASKAASAQLTRARGERAAPTATASLAQQQQQRRRVAADTTAATTATTTTMSSQRDRPTLDTHAAASVRPGAAQRRMQASTQRTTTTTAVAATAHAATAAAGNGGGDEGAAVAHDSASAQDGARRDALHTALQRVPMTYFTTPLSAWPRGAPQHARRQSSSPSSSLSPARERSASQEGGAAVASNSSGSGAEARRGSVSRSRSSVDARGTTGVSAAAAAPHTTLTLQQLPTAGGVVDVEGDAIVQQQHNAARECARRLAPRRPHGTAHHASPTTQPPSSSVSLRTAKAGRHTTSATAAAATAGGGRGMADASLLFRVMAVNADGDARDDNATAAAAATSTTPATAAAVEPRSGRAAVSLLLSPTPPASAAGRARRVEGAETATTTRATTTAAGAGAHKTMSKNTTSPTSPTAASRRQGERRGGEAAPRDAAPLEQHVALQPLPGVTLLRPTGSGSASGSGSAASPSSVAAATRHGRKEGAVVVADGGGFVAPANKQRWEDVGAGGGRSGSARGTSVMLHTVAQPPPAVSHDTAAPSLPLLRQAVTPAATAATMTTAGRTR